jgi:hypothetical protein
MGWGLVLSLAVPLVARAGAGAEEASTPGEGDGAETRVEAPAPDAAPVYRPPARGKPRARVGGAVRGAARDLPSLHVLVPEHTGQTLSEQPSLFWYLDGPPPEGATLVFTLIDETSVDPLVEAELERPARAGIYRIELAEHAVRLGRGTEYEWSVVLIVDPEQRSKDIVSAGWIDRVEAPADLRAAGASRSVQAYAEHGLWYDALAAAADRMRADPANAALRGARDSLLRQVGLGLAVAGSGG